ncbi:MAG TPA: lysophospholipid acyltransferase family protein [Polyangiaceae bacterium]|nr:lysophospholipid acyltransferase family protein [Polyangiaceae bacterium]
MSRRRGAEAGERRGPGAEGGEVERREAGAGEAEGGRHEVAEAGGGPRGESAGAAGPQGGAGGGPREAPAGAGRREAAWVESTFWRRLLMQSAQRGPDWALRAVPVVAGCLFGVALPSVRRGVRRGLWRVRGQGSRLRDERDVYATFVAYAQSLTEGVAALGPQAGRVRFEIEAPEFFYRLAEHRQGCVFVTAHTSGFEVAGAGLGRALGLPVVMAMRAEPNAEARAMHDAERARAGLEVVHVGDDPLAVLRLAGEVRRGKAVGLQIDRLPPGARGVEVPLFGGRARLPLGPFALARATGVPIVAVWTRRTGFFRVSIRAEGPWRLGRGANPAEIEAVAAEVAASFERWVRPAPHHWFDWGKGVGGGE